MSAPGDKEETVSKGKKNIYVCGHCGVEIVTEAVVDGKGLMPFVAKCDMCGRLLLSSFCDVDQSQKPTHEWYKQNPTERADIAKTPHGVAMLRDHVDRGGLLLREIVK